MLGRSVKWMSLYLAFYPCLLWGQELPPVQTYEPDDYQGGNQNWAITQDEQRFLYTANNKGLLEFNGMQWSLYPSPNETIIRCVQAHQGRIYTGCYMEFGVWEREATGRLVYRSLADSVRTQMAPDEHFWDIEVFQGVLVFQSLDQLFIYAPETGDVESFTPDQGIDKLFVVEQELLYSDPTRHLFVLEGGKARMLTRNPLPSRIIHVQKTEAGLLILTDLHGFYLLNNEQELLNLEEPELLRQVRFYSAHLLRDGRLALGTISEGVFILDHDLKLIHHLAQANGLSNNTVLSLFEDEQSNIWVGTDNGVSRINMGSPFRKFTDLTGHLGTVYAARYFMDRLYLGTNQGLFVQKGTRAARFELVPGTKGQVWSLFAYDDRLFCGHDQGTFLIEGEQAMPIFSESGTWMLSTVPDRPELLIQGNYSGLSVLERTDTGWGFRNKIMGFDYSARFLAMIPGREVYISHEYKGVFGLQLDTTYHTVEKRIDYEEPRKSKNAGLTRFADEVLYYSRDGVFRLAGLNRGFVRDEHLSSRLAAHNYESGRMVVEEPDRLWCFTTNQLVYLEKAALRDRWVLHTVSVPMRLLNAMSGYENVTHLTDQQYLIGTADGYLTLNLAALPALEHEIFLTEAISANVHREEWPLPLYSAPSIAYRRNSLSFKFSVPVYNRFFVPQFQYRLLGLVDEWSEWSGEGSLSFRNLPYGRYTLEVRSRLGQERSVAPLSYSFMIRRPWYLSYWAIVCYTLLGILCIYFVHRAYTRYYQQKEEKWRADHQRRIQEQQREAEMEMIRLRNEQLQKDVDSKNRELAISTMSLVNKKELLHQIKDALQQKAAPEDNIRKVLRTIDQNIDEKETWNFFKEAFENADQDFFKKIQERHPSLTHNDLKLCAYLRLNLSSKEIAPLLNISPRSVEVKRYRLRKKMNLEHDEGLTEHILAI